MSRLLVAPLRPGLRVVGILAQHVRRWPVESQQAARRNAMLACTALAARRAERDQVGDYLRTMPGVVAVAAHA